MSDIPTWTERCEVHSDHQSGMVTNAMIQMRMQEEIDDLRAENARLREALERIANAAEDAAVWWLQDLARAALAEQEEK